MDDLLVSPLFYPHPHPSACYRAHPPAYRWSPSYSKRDLFVRQKVYAQTSIIF